MLITLDQITSGSYKSVYFSPHLDDVALSCGGRVVQEAQKGEKILVVTIFSGGSEIDIESGPFSAFEDMEGRRREDKQAMETLGADFIWLGFDEAIQRAKRYRSFFGLISRVVREDAVTIEKITQTINEIAEGCADAKLYFPLGVGNHVDHQIVNELGRNRSVKEGERIRFYEETPYASIPYLVEHRLRKLEAMPPSTLRPLDLRSGSSNFGIAREALSGILKIKILRESIRGYQKGILFFFIWLTITFQRLFQNSDTGPGWRVMMETIDIGDYQSIKTEAVACYETQVSALFGDINFYLRLMLEYSSLIGGKKDRYTERIWCQLPG